MIFNEQCQDISSRFPFSARSSPRSDAGDLADKCVFNYFKMQVYSTLTNDFTIGHYDSMAPGEQCLIEMIQITTFFVRY